MIEDLIGETEIKFLIALALALLAGVMIGGERALRGKPAGISTQTLVISGAMLFAFMSHQVGGDPSRIAAQIVTGIGFLGAGIILKSEASRRVTNVTTAASIWYSAGIGMALGFGFYFIAIVGAVYAVLISRIPHLREQQEQ